MVLVNFLCSCWLCLFFLVGASASDSPSSFLFSFFNLVFFFSSCCLSSFLGCMSSCSCFFPPPLASFPSLVFPSLHHLCYFCFFFLSFLLLCMYLVWLFLLLWFLSLFLLFLSLCFFFSPAPPRAFGQESHGLKNKSFCLPFWDPCENVLSQSLFLFSLVDFFHPQNMFLFHVLGLSFDGVRDSLLLHICFFLCLVFSTQPSFGPTCLLCLHSLDSLSSLFELFIFFVFLLVWCFCYGFWFLSCQFLSSSWDCLSLIALSWCCFFYFVSWLLVCVCVGVGFWAAFWRELSGGVVWIWPTGRGQYIFRVFS